MTYPQRQDVLDFLDANPDITTRRDIARGLNVKGPQRARLREILSDLEEEGLLTRAGRRAVAVTDRPPPTTLVVFQRLDDDGDLVGQPLGRDGPYGPEVIYAGPAHGGKARGSRPGARPGGRAPGVGDRALCKLQEAGGEWKARVIKILDARQAEGVVGLFTRVGRGGRIESSNRRDRDDFLVDEADAADAETGDLVRADVKPTRGYGPKRAVVREVIGRAGDPRAASLIAIHTHGLVEAFPPEVEAEARAARPARASREDLTRTPLVTIDPEDARDHDDAVYAEALADGWKVIVAIADVAAHVPEGSALDREAYRRGNSTYFPDRVVPMLPFALSADACSLREDEPRPCLAVEMEFDTNGLKRRHRFFRAMMRSHGNLSYEAAQTAIDGQPRGRAQALLEPVLKPLWGAYDALCRARAGRGPLDLDLPEHKIVFAEDGTVERISTKARYDAHRLIEEFMIQANVAAAETLEQARMGLVYRVHDSPTDTKLAAFSEFLKTLDRKWPLGERAQTARFNRLLAEVADTDHQVMVTEMVLRTQSQAVYAPDNLGHFGLNLRRYAHFTSPIRRYADLVVHRALIRALDLGPDGISDAALSRLEEIASHITETERRSMAAERDATDRYLALFLKDRIGAEFEGRITGVTRAGLFVRLADTSADGFVPISSLSDEYWVFDEAAMSLVARGSGKRFDLGQAVRVKLMETAPLQGGLRLEVLSPPRPKRKGEPLPAARTGRGRGGSAPGHAARDKGPKGPAKGKAAKHRRRKESKS